MAHDALHLYVLERVVADPRLPGEVAALLRRHARCARAGAVLIDMPYFEGFALRALGHLRGTPEVASPWGDVFHREGALRLARGLLDAARDQPDPGPLAALALGHLTHVALDLETHPYVNRYVAGVERGSTTEATRHREVENAQLELWHRAHRGARLFGTPRLLELATVRTDLLGLGDLSRSLERVLQREFGDAPPRSAWRRWTLGLWQYAAVVSGPLGRLYLPEQTVKALRPWFDGRELEFSGLIDATIRRTVQDLSDAWALARAPGGLERSRFAERFPERNLDDPAKPIG
jgi:hypothetical protein